MRLALCQAVWNGEVVDVRSGGSLFPFDEFCIWVFDKSLRTVHLTRHVYPASREHMSIVGDRLVVEHERDEIVPYGQRIVASTWKNAVAWLSRHALIDSIASPVLLEAVLDYGRRNCVTPTELPEAIAEEIPEGISEAA